MCYRVLLLATASFGFLRAQEGAEYLQSAIRDLNTLNSVANHRRVDGTTRVLQQTRKMHASAPPLTLTKGELAALYEAAVAKGNMVKLDPGEGQRINAAVHELDDHPKWGEDHEHTTMPPDDGSGYYYYYYPIKSFIDELSSQPAADHKDYHYYHHDVTTTPSPPAPPPHYHHHEHNVHIAPMKTMMDTDKKKGLEPLFMAISGFIGMAVMFVLSVIVFPKLGIMKPKANLKQTNPEVATIAKIALQAIEGHDCVERLACELGKTARGFNFYDNRFVKFLRRITPSAFSRQIDKVGKYTDRKRRCAAIQCKRKSGGNKKTKPGTKRA